MIDLSKYTHQGNFKLHSGQYNDTFYDVKEMIVDNKLYEILDYIISNLDIYRFNTVVGIESAGAIIASHLPMKIHDLRLAIITKENKIVGKVVEPYLLIDDVISTGRSIQDAIDSIGTHPTNIFSVVDRRDIKSSFGNIEVESIFKV